MIIFFYCINFIFEKFENIIKEETIHKKKQSVDFVKNENSNTIQNKNQILNQQQIMESIKDKEKEKEKIKEKEIDKDKEKEKEKEIKMNELKNLPPCKNNLILILKI